MHNNIINLPLFFNAPSEEIFPWRTTACNILRWKCGRSRAVRGLILLSAIFSRILNLFASSLILGELQNRIPCGDDRTNEAAMSLQAAILLQTSQAWRIFPSYNQMLMHKQSRRNYYNTPTVHVTSTRVKNGNSPAYKFAHLHLRQYEPHEF